jgi:hypothetical protein
MTRRLGGVVARVRGAGLSLLALCVLATAVACDAPDTEAEFEQFLRDRADVLPETGGLPDAGEASLTSGRYFMAVSTTLSPANELFIEATVTVDASGDTAAFVLQPLKTDESRPGRPRDDPRVPVGDAITVNDVPVTGGSFTIEVGEIAISGQANPITGSNILADLTLIGVVIDDDTFCGTVNGDVLQPLQNNVDGSSFGAIRYDGDFTEIGDAFLARCPEGNGGGDPDPDAGGD